MPDLPPAPQAFRLGMFARLLRTARSSAQRINADPHLKAALDEDHRIGQGIAATVRTVATVTVMLLLPVLNREPAIIYPILLLAGLLGVDFIRSRTMKGGRSPFEVPLITADVLLLLMLTVLPNPLIPDRVPFGLSYQNGRFLIFFVLLTLATLVYSWRTIWTMGLILSAGWLAGVGLVVAFGNRNEEIAAGLASGLAAFPKILSQIDPNSVQLNRRIEEVVVLLLVTFILTLKSWRSEQLVLRQAELAGERANLSRYFSPNMVEMLASRHHDIGGVRSAEVAVLFADIVGFTKMAEELPPDQVLNLLRRYYAAIEKAVFDNQGTLDKYLGDGVMATFGTPEPGPQDALNALRAARAIIAAMDSVATDDGSALRVSVGLHFGRVTMGDVGPARRLEFAVLGDTVNVASRLEAATRKLGCRILCSDDLMQQVGDDPAARDFSPRRGMMLRGRASPINGWSYGASPPRPT